MPTFQCTKPRSFSLLAVFIKTNGVRGTILRGVALCCCFIKEIKPVKHRMSMFHGYSAISHISLG